MTHETNEVFKEIASRVAERLSALEAELDGLNSIEATRCRLEICQARFNSGIKIAEMMQQITGSL